MQTYNNILAQAVQELTTCEGFGSGTVILERAKSHGFNGNSLKRNMCGDMDFAITTLDDDEFLKRCILLWSNNTGFGPTSDYLYHYNYDLNECESENGIDIRKDVITIGTTDCSAYLNVSYIMCCLPIMASVPTTIIIIIICGLMF